MWKARFSGGKKHSTISRVGIIFIFCEQHFQKQVGSLKATVKPLKESLESKSLRKLISEEGVYISLIEVNKLILKIASSKTGPSLFQKYHL